MSDSLKDQLLALGLASNKQQPKTRKKPKIKKADIQEKEGAKEISLDQAYRIRNKEERQKKEQAIARKRESERKAREINQKLKAVVKAHAIRDEKADTKRNFLYKGRIRSVLASREQITQINSGSLGVVYLRGNYHLLPADRIDEIREFAADHIPDLGGSENEEEKDNPVPDDLIW